MNPLNNIAIIGPTASGKTSLALELARQHDGIILSLDSLALYRHIDIASAKPSLKERGNVPHFGIDITTPDVPFDVTRFIKSYQEAASVARQGHRPLIIVGGSSFYLKTLLDGISPLPHVSDETKRHVQHLLEDLTFAYHHLTMIDPVFTRNIAPADRYRIEKGLMIHCATRMEPTRWFADHPPVPIITSPLPIYEITVNRSVLRERISLRTDRMLRDGLIDEVCSLEHTYGRAPNAMGAIGIKETLQYLDGCLMRGQLHETIITHTARLAKRQVTFNKSQFKKTIQGDLQLLRRELLD